MILRAAVLSSLALLAVSCNNRTPTPPSEAVKDAAVQPASTAPSASASASASPSGPTKCGDATCAPGEYCCNESCSICAPKDGSCILTVCDPKDKPKAVACKTDADCATWSSYCGDLPCACLAIGKASGPPKCQQPNTVRCLVDPCQKKTAACQAGTCVVTAK